MANRFDISMLGDKELSAALAALPDNLERKVLARAMRDGGKFLLTLTQAAAPVSTDPKDPHRGRLKATLKLRTLRRRKGRVGVSIQTGTREELGIVAQAAARAKSRATSRRGLERGVLRHFQAGLRGYYPAHVELGHKTELGTRTVPPNPYLRGPLHSAREAVLAVIKQSVDAGIERELVKASGTP